MSSIKFTKDEVQSIVDRAIAEFGLRNERELSEYLKISESDKTKRKQRGTIVKLIERKAYQERKNVHYILTGKEEKDKDQKQVPATEIDLEEKVKQLEARIIILERLLSQSKSNPGRRWYDDVIGKKK